MATTAKRAPGLTGAAGEYFVAAELSLRGWLATVTIKNAPYTDVLAQKPREGLAVAIQTKTSSGRNAFQLGAKAENPSVAPNQWYVLVRLGSEALRPAFFIIPHNVIAGGLFAQHRRWLSLTAKDGTPHKDTPMRSMPVAHVAAYEDRWDLLEVPTDKAPLLIDPWYDHLVDEFGLPPGHPGWPKRPKRHFSSERPIHPAA